MRAFIEKIDKALIKLLDSLLFVCIIVMVGIIILQVVCRYWLSISTPYAEEFARLAIVWCIFLGSALAIRYDDHMRVTILVNKLPVKLQFALQIVGHLAILVLAYIMVVYGIHHLGIVWKDHGTSLSYSRGWFYLPVPITGILFILYTIANFFKCILGILGETHKEEGIK